MCDKCVRPLIDATAALAAENNANEGGARPVAVIASPEVSHAKAPGQTVFQASPGQELQRGQAALEEATVQRFAKLLTTLPNKQLVCGEKVLSAPTKKGKEALQRYYEMYPTDGFLINKYGLRGFTMMHSKALRWTPLADGKNLAEAAGIITATAGQPGVHPDTILAAKIAAEVEATQSILVNKRGKGGQSLYKWTLRIPYAKGTPDCKFIVSTIFGKQSKNLHRVKAESGCDIWVNQEIPNIVIQGLKPKDIGKAVAQLQPILDAPKQRAERLHARFSYDNDSETSSYEGADYWEGDVEYVIDPSGGKLNQSADGSFSNREWFEESKAPDDDFEINFEADQGTQSMGMKAPFDVEVPQKAAGRVTPPASDVFLPVKAKALANAGPTIRLLREKKVADATLLQLVNLGLTSIEQIMAAHDDGLSKFGIKKGPRMRILKVLSPLLLKFEDEAVRDLLERSRLGKYRARCAEEQIDIEALSYFADEPDTVLEKDLGVRAEDIEAFRSVIRCIEN